MTDQTPVGVVGGGPAVEAIEVALDDRPVEAIDPESVGSVELAAVVGPAGGAVFDRVDRLATGPWVAVELGGIGGRAVADVDAAVSLLHAGGPCFACLRTRVVAAGAEEVEPNRPPPADIRFAGAVAGRLAAGEESPGRVVELPLVERELLPVPGCRCGGERVVGGPVGRTDATLAIEQVLDQMEGAIDDRLGIVTDVGEVHSFPVPYYLATLGDTTDFSDAEVARYAAGVAAEWNPAFAKAVGEALERYASSCYRTSTFEVAAAADLDDAVPPAAFVRSPAFADPDPTEPIPWVRGEALHSGDPASLPAEFAVFPPPDHRHRPSITTGLGLGTDGVGALLSGLYEVIERDATMLAWYSSFEPLDLSVAEEGFSVLARRARAESLAVTPLLLTQDVDVPVVAVAVHREDEWPRFAVGSDADLDAGVAARGALEEALQNWMELRAMGRERASEEEPTIARHADFPDAARRFVQPATSVAAGEVGPDPPPTRAQALDVLIERLVAAGLDAYAVRLTTRDVETLGLEVVRVLVPGAQPLFTGDPFFGERARRIPELLGFSPRLDRGYHPYP